MLSADWHPSCTLETACFRRDLIEKIRSFFRSSGALEVETPVLAHASGCDPHLDWFQTESFVDGVEEGGRSLRFLITSPEYHMKRLLAAGWGDIWQLTRAFRSGDRGERHLEEFALLEWYRVGWSAAELMEEVWQIAALALPQLARWEEITYRNAFLKYAGCDPFDSDGVASESARGRAIFKQSCAAAGVACPDLNGEERLFWLHGVLVAPKLGWDRPQFLTEWPADQAALAEIQTDSEGRRVGLRFELYYRGVELCNGYRELCDATEQRERFEKEQRERLQMGKRAAVIDRQLLQALESGLPPSAGVALGLDRLVMLALRLQNIDQAVTFTG